MKIGFIAIEDIKDVSAFSGTYYYLQNHLSEHVEVIPISPLKNNSNIIRIIYKVLGRITNKKYLYNKNILVSKLYAKEIEKVIQEKNLDILLTMNTNTIAYLKTDIPIVLYADGTFAVMKDYYDWYTNLSNISIYESEKIEKMALHRCDTLIYSSIWAKNSAINDYGISEEKVHNICFGLNLSTIPTNDDVKQFIQKRINKNVCELLFVGKEFDRKGGKIAIDTIKYLNEKLNINTKLTIVGCNPNIEYENLEVIPFLDKKKPDERDKYDELLKKSDFFILPTRADCTPMVFAEANSYGLPIITTDTGGVSSIVQNGINGIMLNIKDDESKYATQIAELWKNKILYEEMSFNSRKYYEDNLNWDVNVRKLLKIIKSIDK